ncbi:MAG TPA: hypothetical protein DCR93_05075, partial [Cytophagales bacterium]|nr:hypothetical protein [Cytophagales bacterium]
MKASLTEFITKRVNRPNEQEIEEILGIFEMRNVAKGTLLKKPDTVCDFLAFVVSGSVRAFVMKETGDEITEYVTLPNNIATDLISVRTGIPNAIAIDCLEDSTLLVAALADYFPLLDSNLTLNIIVR